MNKKIHTTNKYSNARYILEAFQLTKLIHNSQVFYVKLSSSKQCLALLIFSIPSKVQFPDLFPIFTNHFLESCLESTRHSHTAAFKKLIPLKPCQSMKKMSFPVFANYCIWCWITYHVLCWIQSKFCCNTCTANNEETAEDWICIASVGRLKGGCCNQISNI